MTIWSLLEACRRQARLLVIMVVLSIAIAATMLSRPGAYWSQTNAIFLAPSTALRPGANTLQSPTRGLIATAGLIERMINAGRSLSPTASSTVSIVDQGLRHGWQIRLPNSGGQWTYNFDRPVLDVQSVGTSSMEARALMGEALGVIRDQLRTLQDDAGVPADQHIRIEFSPTTPRVDHVASHARLAALLTVALGTALAVAAAVVVDGLRQRRSNSPPVGDGLGLR